MPTSPDVQNYFSGTGIVSFKASGQSTYRDLGNAPDVTLELVLDTTDHKSSRDGARSVDRIFVNSKKGQLTLTLEEITPENLALAFLGTVETNTAGLTTVKGFTANSLTGALRVVGTNEIGSKYQLDALNVQFIPTGGGFKFIAPDSSTIELTGNVSKDVNDDYFTITELSDEVTA